MKVSNCDVCVHLEYKKGIGACCGAFPNGIDKERRLNLFDLSLKGKVCNNGVKFEYGKPKKKQKYGTEKSVLFLCPETKITIKTEEAQMIKIKCQTNDTLELKDLSEFQGNLKERTDADFEKIINSIKKHGFAVPFFVWKQGKKNWCLDGHG